MSAAKRRTLQKKDSIAQFAVDLSGDQLKELKTIFVELDKDKDGNLSASELLQMFKELGVSASSTDISRLMGELDRDGDGRISFKEFVEGISWMKKSALFNKASPTQGASDSVAGGFSRSPSVAKFVQSLDNAKIQSIKELFELADGDGDGIISKREFASLIKQLGLSVSAQQFELLFTTLDSSNDGKIEFSEFLSGMRWLEKGSNLSASVSNDANAGAEEDETLLALKELREQNKVLRGIIAESISKALSTARVSLKNQDIATAKAVLEVVDIDFLLDVRDVTGTIVSEKDQALFTKMKTYITENE